MIGLGPTSIALGPTSIALALASIALALASIALALALGLPFAAGAGLARALGLSPRRGLATWLAWSWVLGALATALVVFAWMLTPLAKGSPLVPGLAVAALGALGWLRGRRATPLEARAPAAIAGDAAGRAPRWERALLAAVVAALVLLTLQRILAGDAVPVHAGDEANFWALKAKLVFRAGGLNDAFLAMIEDPHYLYHRDYPLLNPLLQLWTFACFGEVTHVANRLPMQMFALALVPALAAALARVVRPAAAAALLVVVLATSEAAHQARTAHADLMVALGVALAFDAWLAWRARGAAGWFRLAAVGLALAAFAKGDGLVHVLAIALAWPAARLLAGRAAPRAAARAPRGWLLLPVLVIALTWAVNAHFGFRNDIAITEGRDESFLELLVGEAPTRAPLFLAWCARELIPARAWAGHLPLVFVALCALLAPRLRRDDLAFGALAIAAAAAGFALILLGTPHDQVSPTWHLETALPRISWQLVPVLALWIGAAAGRFLPGFAPPGVDGGTR